MNQMILFILFLFFGEQTEPGQRPCGCVLVVIAKLKTHFTYKLYLLTLFVSLSLCKLLAKR